jgi:integrase
MIQPATMAPLLAWALLCVEELAPDLTASIAARQQMVAAVGGIGAGSLAGRQRAQAVIAEQFPGETPLPAAAGPGGASGRRFSSTYIAARYGQGVVARGDLTWALQQIRGPRWADALDESLPQPLNIPVAGRIANKPWLSHLDWREAPTFKATLVAACLIVVCYLTGMRPHEALSLRKGCLEEATVDSGALRYIVRGLTRKGLRAEAAHLPVVGEEKQWQTLKPAADAIKVLEAMVGDNEWLFSSGHEGGNVISTSTSNRRISDFIDWANNQATRLQLPMGLTIPQCPGGPVTLKRFRRTLAWHIRHQPNGHVALAVQYQHLSVATGEGYAGAKRSGFADLLDDETRAAALHATATLRAEIEAGGGVSGLGAERAMTAAQRFPGTYLSGREERALLGDKDLVVFDNPNAFALCLNDPDKALCLSDRAKKAGSTPNALRCQGGACPNIVFTDTTIERKRSRAAHLRQSAEAAPRPLAVRLSERASRMEAELAEHDQNRRTATP